MNANKYQELAARTLIDKPGFEISDNDMMIIWNAVGLAGEAGECCEKIKKGILHQHGLDRVGMKKELGDVLWYVAALCSKLGLDMGDVMDANIEKLKQRYPDGYKSADSIARVDTKPDAFILGTWGGFDEMPGTELTPVEPIPDMESKQWTT